MALPAAVPLDEPAERCAGYRQLEREELLMAQTAADVDIFIQDNATFQDAFKFLPPVGGALNLTGMSFTMAVKASRDDSVALVTFTSPTQIVTADAVNCIINFNVVDTTIQLDLPAAE